MMDIIDGYTPVQMMGTVQKWVRCWSKRTLFCSIIASSATTPESSSELQDATMLAVARALVPHNKRRNHSDVYGLDLRYVHPRIIVMGYPASGLEAIYRNSRSQVLDFLRKHHGDRYKVFNFCAEAGRRYNTSEFDDRAESFPIEDHDVPTFHQIILFSEAAGSWLNKHDENIVVLHSKNGKGRTGMMACILLVYLRWSLSATDAIECFNRARGRDRRGLTGTSQKRWVYYAERIFHTVPLAQNEPRYRIEEIRVCNAPTGVPPPLLRLFIYVLDPITATKSIIFETTGYEHFLVRTPVQGCVQIVFHRLPAHSQGIIKRHASMWFHTLFASPDPATGVVTFSRSQLDWVTQDRKMRRFPAAYEIQMLAHVEEAVFHDEMQAHVEGEVVESYADSRSLESLDQQIDGVETSVPLDVRQVEFLEQHRNISSSMKAIDYAALHGRVEEIKHLHKYLPYGCTTKAMDYAAMFGYLDIVKFLHENRREGCTKDAMDNAVKYGYWDVVRYLHEHRSEGCSHWAMQYAAERGDLEMIKYLETMSANFSLATAEQAAREAGHQAVAEYLAELQRRQ